METSSEQNEQAAKAKEVFETLIMRESFGRHPLSNWTTLIVLEEYGKQNDTPVPQIRPRLIPGTSEYIILHNKRDFADVIKLRTFRWGRLS